MTNIDLIHLHLPQELWQIASEYTITDTFLEKMPDLIVLVLNSKSMDTKEEKQSWFNLLPLMTEDQITKLVDILVREKQKLEEIEQKYEQKKEAIITKYVQKFDDNSYQQKIVTLKQQEAVHEAKEDQEADQLLNNL